MIKFNTLLVKSYGSEIITNQEEFEIDYLGIPAYFSIIKKSYIRYIDNKIDKNDINSGEFPLLLVLNERDNITQKQLSDLTKNSEGLMTRVLKKLENNGYVERKVDGNNKRRKIISITPKGEKIANEIKEYQQQWEYDTFNFLNENDFENFKKNLKKAVFTSRMLNDE